MLFRSEETNFHDEIEEKRWSEGWAVLMADGMERRKWLGKRRGRGKKKRKKKKEKKRDGLKDETRHNKWGPTCQYIYRNVIENIVMKTKNG